MKVSEVAQMLGITQQGLNLVVRGERNCGFSKAKRFSALIGGEPTTWLDPEAKKQRRELWEKFRARTKGPRK